MNKWITFLIVIISTLSVDGVQQLQYSDLVSPKYVKRAKTRTCSALKADGHNSNINTNIKPKIHQSIWEEFCLHHLQIDPDGCSAWCVDKNGQIQLEFLLLGHAQVQIDRELNDQLGNLACLIPTRTQGYKNSCDHAACPSCLQTVIRAICCEEEDDCDEDEDGNEIVSYRYFLVYKCGCTGDWWLDLDNLEEEEDKIYSGWQFCKSPTIYHGYLDWYHQTYFRHLKNFLCYSEENPACNCYWPQVNVQAKTISDISYDNLEKLFEFSRFEKISTSFSPYLLKRSQHGFLSGLLTHAFFYSHYRDILLDLDQYSFKELPSHDYSLTHKYFVNAEEEIQKPFLAAYNQCLQKHPHPKIYYERGMILFHRGENLDALEDIHIFISYVENHHYQELLNSDLYLKEGRLLSESLSYDEAIVALTRAIEKDPKNVDAYFERAIAYFEAGDFSNALSDYLASGIHPKKVEDQSYLNFGQGIALGMIKGGQDSAIEFVPSLLASFRGISRGIWACVSSPIVVSQDMVDCVKACLEFIKNNTAKEFLCKIAPELQECLKKWDQLDDYTKGRYSGYIIGKYGVDIFIGTGSMKAIQLYRNLRKANALLTLETASISPKLAQEVLEQAIKEEAIRNGILKSGNLKIQWDKQGKHVKGHRNFASEKNKSIFTHQEPQKLIDEFAGTGKKYGSTHPGKPGFKEDIDFQELIGYALDESTGGQMPTSWGRIHYAKDGVHIVPIRPRG